MQNIVLRISITSLYGSQPSSVGFWIQNCDFMTRINSLHVSLTCKTAWLAPESLVSMGSRPHLRICEWKTACLGPVIQVSMGPSPHLRYCAFKTATLWPELIVSIGPRPHLWICTCKMAWLPPELLVSMGPSPHLWFCAFKTAYLGSELLVCMESQTSSVDVWRQNSALSTRIRSLHGSQPSSVVLACKTTTLAPEWQDSVSLWQELIVSMCPWPAKQRN